MVYTTGRFLLQMERFSDGNDAKTYLQYGTDASRIVYEEGDEVMVNGKPFTITRDGSQWFAVGSEITATKFYAAYVDGTCDNWNESAGTYGVNINPHMDENDHNKVILAGTSDNGTVLTLKPACAIIRVNTGAAGSSWTNVKVGFDENKIPKRGTINTETRAISPVGYMDACAQDQMGEMLAMRWSKQGAAGQHVTDEDGYWYVAVPIAGSSVTTTLYFMWTNGGTTTYFKTNNAVTLNKGYVYTVGTERQSPFTDKGIGKYFFTVSAGGSQVAFTAGNLQCQRYYDFGSYSYQFKWRFAESQTSIAGQINNNNIGGTDVWFDLFGYGTSNWNSGATAYVPSSTSTTNGDYYASDLSSTNADWGKYNGNTPGIYYGSSLSQLPIFRTLTSSEWSYLINRSGKAGLVRIAGSVFGLMLLPNTGLNGAGTWSNTTDVSLAGLSLTSALSLSETDWNKLEAIGAIFLPAAGTRSGTNTTSVNNVGTYWSATNNATKNAHSLNFNGTSTATGTTTKSTGCSVRLVISIG